MFKRIREDPWLYFWAVVYFVALAIFVGWGWRQMVEK